MKQEDKQKDTPAGGDPGSSIKRWLYLAFFALLGIYLWNSSQAAEETTWSTFNTEMLQPHDVAKVDIVNNEEVYVYIRQQRLQKEQYHSVAKTLFGRDNPGPHYRFRIGSVEVFNKQLQDAQANFDPDERVEVVYSKQENWWSAILVWLVPLFLLALFWIYLKLKI